MKEIVVGLSGGIDSAVSLYLLKQQGWKPVGVSLKLESWGNEPNACCTPDSVAHAEALCEDLGVPFHKYDVSPHFKKNVMEYFVGELRDAKTPNPCVMCNRFLKFAKLFEWAHKHGIAHVATGHYAATALNKRTKKWELRIPKDANKDQTYGLCFLPQDWLRFIVFPLAKRTKLEVYNLARRQGLDDFVHKKQSQDLCFVSSNDYNDMLRKEVGTKRGSIVDTDGKKLGKHKGLHFYTVGQRSGLGLSGKFYVKELRAEKNELIVASSAKEVSSSEVLLSPFSFVSGVVPKRKMRVDAKARYRQKAVPATLFQPKDDKVRVVFDEPLSAVAPGQFCVFYKHKTCLGGGRIL